MAFQVRDPDAEVCPSCNGARGWADFLEPDGQAHRTCFTLCRSPTRYGRVPFSLRNENQRTPKHHRRGEDIQRAQKEMDTQTLVVVSDVHIPYQCPKACLAVEDLIRDLRPAGLVIAGDFLDFYELSRYNAQSVARMEGRRISDTFAAANTQLDRWLGAAGPGNHHYLDGNHEGRLRDWLETGQNSAFLGDEAVDIEVRLNLKARGVTYHRGETSMLRLGKLLVTHGAVSPVYHAAAMHRRYACSVVYGHTHSPQIQTFAAWNAQQVACGLGHLMDADSPAASYAPPPNRWQQGFAVVTVFPDETFQIQSVNLWAGRFAFGGKVYG